MCRQGKSSFVGYLHIKHSPEFKILSLIVEKAVPVLSIEILTALETELRPFFHQGTSSVVIIKKNINAFATKQHISYTK